MFMASTTTNEVDGHLDDSGFDKIVNVVEEEQGEKRFKHDPHPDISPSDAETPTEAQITGQPTPRGRRRKLPPLETLPLTFKHHFRLDKTTSDEDDDPSLTTERIEYLNKLLFGDIVTKPFAQPFLEPLKDLFLSHPEYASQIRHPINLIFIKENLTNHAYQDNIDDLIIDLFILIDNCFHFNMSGSSVSQDGEAFQQALVNRMKESNLFTNAQITFLEATHPNKYENYLTTSRSLDKPNGSMPQRNKYVENRLLPDRRIPRSTDSFEAFLPLIDQLPPYPQQQTDSLFTQLHSLPSNAYDQIVQMIRKYSLHCGIDVDAETIQFSMSDLDPKLLQFIHRYCLYIEQLTTG